MKVNDFIDYFNFILILRYNNIQYILYLHYRFMSQGYKKNKIQQIRGFCTVIEEGSILQASKKMNTAQSNVSLQVSSLEKTLGIILFKRENQRLIPTPEALRFYKVCKKTLDEVDFLFENASKNIQQDYDNMVKLAGHSYMLSHILPPYFKQLIAVNPKVQFELYNCSYQEGMDMLESGIIDFAVFPAKKEDLPEHIEIREFFKCQFGLAIPKDHPLINVPDNEITWNMIAKYDFVNLGKGITAQGFKNIMKDNSIDSRFTMHNGTWEICMGMIKEGLSIGGIDVKYSEWHNDIVIKSCPKLMPEYKFHTLRNKTVSTSKSSAELLDVILHSQP